MGGPMEAAFRPMARLLTGPRPEEAETVVAPTDRGWGTTPRDTCAEAATEADEGADEGAEGKEEEEWRLVSPSIPGCCRDGEGGEGGGRKERRPLGMWSEINDITVPLVPVVEELMHPPAKEWQIGRQDIHGRYTNPMKLRACCRKKRMQMHFVVVLFCAII